MKKICICSVLAMLMLTISAVKAQVVQIPYAMSFEDEESAEWANWVTNPGALGSTISDKWERGTALHSDGDKGLYISNDGGVTSNYGSDKCLQFVYRDFQFEDGNYYLSFDWMCPDSCATLYAGQMQWLPGTLPPYTQMNNMIAQQGNTITWPAIGTPMQTLQFGTTWQNGGWQISVKNPTNAALGKRIYRIYFAWQSSVSSADSVRNISACIDNIQITDARCAKPSNLAIEITSCDSVRLSWDGSSARYQLQYRKVGTTTWRSRNTTNAATSLIIENMKEGNYDFRVRGTCYEYNDDGTCDTIVSPYTYLSNVNVFCPDQHCINYVNLTDTNYAICTYGTTSSSGYYQTYKQAFANRGVVDFGWESVNSRHTVIWDTLAKDPRTNNQLRMVPMGESASVRLGNWNYNYGAEAVTYKFTVDPDNSILLVKYAIVLEDPSGHDDDAMPRFVIQIYDEQGEPLDTLCGKVDLNPLNSDAGWQPVGGSSSSYGDRVVYKDWSLLGLNLDTYAGQTLQVSIATYDCFWSAHYGYAYFVLGCASAHINNTSCGAQQSMTVEAPVGFAYEWYDSKTQTVRSHERNITIGLNDPTDWTCRLTSLENSDCFFELYVNTEPRYPMANFTYTYEPTNCENRYVFTNRSFIRVNNDGKVTDHYDEDCDEYHWDFGFDENETDEKNPGVVIFPEEGGTFPITLSAMIGDGTGSCKSDTTILLEVPAIGDVVTTLDTTICQGSYVDFGGQKYFETGHFVQHNTTKSGCRFDGELNLTVVPTSESVMPGDTICFGDQITRDGQIFNGNKSGNQQIVSYLKNYLGCDSTVIYPIYVYDQIAPEITTQEVDEQHEYAAIYLSGSGYDYYMVDGVKNADLSRLDGGAYTIKFYNDFGCEAERSVNLGACLRNMIFQRWNDVLSLKNKDYREARYKDLEFLSYQWYRDGELLEGATRSYYYQPGGLTVGAEYACLVSMSDGSQEITCSFVPEGAAAAPSVTPTLVSGGETVCIEVPEACSFACYNSTGQKMMSSPLTAGQNYVQMSLNRGVYVLMIEMDEIERPFRICVAE